ncbi:MAG: hypothetical protein Q8N23_27915 [Archangium sp.]|nr:hypothetical protein [Archangium sp.]MDP3573873.1 hypothetical protein [Archangium sp.]
MPSRAAGVQAALGTIYETDRKRVLRRSDLMAKTAVLQLAGRAQVHALREGLDRVLRATVKDPLERELLCAVFGSTLEVSVERWRKERARRPLGTIVREAFRVVARLG